MMSVMMKLSGILAMCLLVAAVRGADEPTYVGPCDVAASPDGKQLFVVGRDAKQILVVDASNNSVARKIDCPFVPTGVAVSPNGATLYVTCGGPAGTVLFLKASSGEIQDSVAVGHTPTGPAVTPNGKRLYVCNRFDNDVSVIDVAAKKVTKRVGTVREPIAAAVAPDGRRVLVANHLPLDPSDSYDVAAAVTVIRTRDHSTRNIRLPNGSSSVRGICVSPDGKYAYVAHILSRYPIPTTQLERGWMNTNALSVIDVGGEVFVNTVLLDEVDLGAANPWGVACTADGASICVTHSGTHELSVIDTQAMLDKLAKAPKPDDDTYGSSGDVSPPNNLAFLVDIRKRIRIQGRGPNGWLGADRTEANGPRGLAMVGAKAYIAVYFSDKLAVVDLKADPYQQVSLVPLGPTPTMTAERWGEMHFHDAWHCFQHWQSCASCHPDGRVDSFNWDLLNDGLGNPKNAKSMLLAHKTPPAMASGVRSDAETGVRKGFTHILFAVPPDEVPDTIDQYLKSLTPVPSPALVDGKLSESAARGKELFFSSEVGCYKCHPQPLYTDLGLYDVGSRGRFDRRDDFDTPTLIECWRTAPYMHDGHYTSLKDLFKKGKHGKRGGDIESLSDQQIDDLVEFVRSL